MSTYWLGISSMCTHVKHIILRIAKWKKICDQTTGSFKTKNNVRMYIWIQNYHLGHYSGNNHSGNPTLGLLHCIWSLPLFLNKNNKSHLLVNWDLDPSIVQMQEARHESRPLNDKSTDHKVEANRWKAIAFEESHQVTETDEHHNVDILEHCK